MGKKRLLKRTQQWDPQKINKETAETSSNSTNSPNPPNPPNSFQNNEDIHKLSDLLQRIFRIDKQDFTFGLYRLLNETRSILTTFLKVQLLECIQAEFKSVDRIDLQKAILTDLVQFFARYYHSGDFSPQRAYAKNERYLITATSLTPVFFWINQDQYYIKSDRYFRDFSFRVKDYQIQFKMVQVDPAINNNKIENAFFLLDSQSDPILIDLKPKKVTVYLQFRRFSLDEQEIMRKQIYSVLSEENFDKKLTQLLIFHFIQEKILEMLPPSEAELKTELTHPISASKKESLLQSKLQEFANKSNTDFFIHRNLEGFLTHELDVFLANGARYGMNAFRNISQCIIKTLGQLENLKRMLWIKKKWVYKTEYIITIDKIPLSFIPQILQNKAQITEWIDLLGFNPLNDSNLKSKIDLPKNFSTAFPFLSIDTKHYDQNFKDSIIESFSDLDNTIDGLLIKSDNFQALRLISTRYQKQINGLYIDPPYNTGGDEFVYKDRFEHSCWLSLMQQTLLEYKPMMAERSQFFISIDDNEVSHLGLLCDKIFGSEYIRKHIIVRSNPIGRTYLDIYKNHEYIVYGTTGNRTFTDLNTKTSPNLPLSLWDEKEMRTENGTKTLNKLFVDVPIQHPKPIELIQKCIKQVNSPNGSTTIPIICDFFAGSGSTAHAILDLYHQDKIQRKYILIEMADYFEHLIIPRIKKVIFARNWNRQQPIKVAMDKDHFTDNSNPFAGQSQMIKYIYLEQFEDTLNNTQILSTSVLTEPESTKGYTIQIEMQKHQTSLKTQSLIDPNRYLFHINMNGNNMTTAIDVVESVNWFLGLHVLSIKTWQHANISYKLVYGLAKSQRILIVWRFGIVSAINSIEDDRLLLEHISSNYQYTRLMINMDTRIQNVERIEKVLEDLMARSTNDG